MATPNAYLAQRDFERVGPILQLLGASVGLVPELADANAKRAAYACDVAYATGYELGFDYLRDQLQVLSTPRPGLGERQLELLRGRPVPATAARPTAKGLRNHRRDRLGADRRGLSAVGLER